MVTVGASGWMIGRASKLHNDVQVESSWCLYAPQDIAVKFLSACCY